MLAALTLSMLRRPGGKLCSYCVCSEHLTHPSRFILLCSVIGSTLCELALCFKSTHYVNTFIFTIFDQTGSRRSSLGSSIVRGFIYQRSLIKYDLFFSLRFQVYTNKCFSETSKQPGLQSYLSPLRTSAGTSSAIRPPGHSMLSCLSSAWGLQCGPKNKTSALHNIDDIDKLSRDRRRRSCGNKRSLFSQVLELESY